VKAKVKVKAEMEVEAKVERMAQQLTRGLLKPSGVSQILSTKLDVYRKPS
jgi:hypothetical protein